MKEYFKEILKLWKNPIWYLTILIVSIITIPIMGMHIVSIVIGLVVSTFIIAWIEKGKK